MQNGPKRPMPPVHSRFQKGQSGNPGGRPGRKKMTLKSLRSELTAALALTPVELEAWTPPTVLGLVAKGLALGAVAGRVDAIGAVNRYAVEPERGRAARVPASLRGLR